MNWSVGLIVFVVIVVSILIPNLYLYRFSSIKAHITSRPIAATPYKVHFFDNPVSKFINSIMLTIASLPEVLQSIVPTFLYSLIKESVCCCRTPNRATKCICLMRQTYPALVTKIRSTIVAN